MRIRIGKDIMTFMTTNEANQILDDLKIELINQHYYNVCNLLIQKIDYYYKYDLLFYIIFNNNIYNILLWKKVCYKLPYNKYLIEIVDFLKKLKSDKELFFNNCILCLKELHPEKNDPIILNNTESSENYEELKTHLTYPIKGITILDCRHEFHSECLGKYRQFKKDCPICISNNSENEDYGLIVWNAQIELHSYFSKIKYEDLYTKNFESPNSGNGNGGVY